MLIVKDLGIQFTTSGVLGFETSQFIEQHNIVDVLINEVITMVCIEINAVLTDCSWTVFEQSHSMPVPLFCTPELWIMFSVNGFYFTILLKVVGLWNISCISWLALSSSASGGGPNTQRKGQACACHTSHGGQHQKVRNGSFCSYRYF